uniref:Uncharacterized protein n=1 Tax=Xiphophorus couchianus TaxID=32473 RepID=A0A3B5MW83_9TELE
AYKLRHHRERLCHSEIHQTDMKYNKSREQKHQATKMENILGFTNHRTCIREAVLLQYYLSGFWWAKDTKFSPTQISFTMAVLHVLLENLREKQMSSVDNMVVFMKAMTAACHCAPSEEDDSSLLNNNEAKALICSKYLNYILLFNSYINEKNLKQERLSPRAERDRGDRKTEKGVLISYHLQHRASKTTHTKSEYFSIKTLVL